MRRPEFTAVFAVLVLFLGGCVATPPVGQAPAPGQGPGQPSGSVRPTTAPPPMTGTTTPPRPSSDPSGFIAPRVMNMPGLEGVIGSNANALANVFGAPRLQVREGDALKLQFQGSACVLDVYLYPLAPGAQPSATYVDARRASDGLDVDRTSCVASLRR